MQVLSSPPRILVLLWCLVAWLFQCSASLQLLRVDAQMMPGIRGRPWGRGQRYPSSSSSRYGGRPPPPPPTGYSRPPYQQHDYSTHFLDQDDWMKDKRSRLFRVDLKSRKPNRLSLTSRIVMCNLAAFVVQAIRPGFTNWGMKLSHEILSGRQLHRLVTPMFLHGGIFHLFTNMYSLSQVGNDVERIFGPGRFLTTYAVSGIAGTLLSAIKSPNPSLGASGAVFGTVSAYFVFLSRNEWLLGSVGESMSMAIAQTLLANVALGLVNPVIDNWAHMGGALGGAAMAYYFGPRLYLSELPNGGRLLIDRPIARLPRYVESIPEAIGDKFQRMARRMHVNRHKLDMTNKPWRNRQQQQQQQYYRQSAPNRSIKPSNDVR